MQCEVPALEGLGQLMCTIDIVRGSVHSDLRMEANVLTLFDTRNSLSHQVADEVQRAFYGPRPPPEGAARHPPGRGPEPSPADHPRRRRVARCRQLPPPGGGA